MPRGAKPTCECGACEKCRRRTYIREYMRRRRAEVPLTDEQRQRGRERSSKWREANRDREAENARRTRARQPEKVRARALVNRAILAGRLERGPCEVCGTTSDVQGHHDDYDRPLDVRWLCRRHHVEEHMGQAA